MIYYLCFYLILHIIMERLTKQYNERTGTYEYIGAFSSAGIFDSIMKGITSTFVKETAKKVCAKALEAAADKVGSHVGEYAVKKLYLL